MDQAPSVEKILEVVTGAMLVAAQMLEILSVSKSSQHISVTDLLKILLVLSLKIPNFCHRLSNCLVFLGQIIQTIHDFVSAVPDH